MKKEYDFSKGVRGKFYRADAKLKLPVFLEPDVAEFIQNYSQTKNKDIQSIVNEWLRNNIRLIRTLL